MPFEDHAEQLLDLLAAVVASGNYDSTTKTFVANPAASAVNVATMTTSGNADVGGTLGVDGVATFDTTVTVGGELGAAAVESEGGIGFFGTEPPGAAAAVTGALSTVADAPAKAVLTSLVAALVATGQATNGTT